MAMETESAPTPSNDLSSFFLPTVCLHSWWLIKGEKDFHGKRLAIAGFTSRERDARRVFISAPIIKRHDLSTLETADGIYLIIRGFIDELRTKENGFPPEAFNNFLFGFPPNWECYAVDCFKEVTTGVDSGNIVTSSGEGPKSPVTIGIDSGNILTSSGEGPKSPVTPIQSQAELIELSEQFVGESVSRKSITPSSNTKRQRNRRKCVLGLAIPQTTKSKRKMTKSVSPDPKRKIAKSISLDPKRKKTKSKSADPKSKMTKSISANSTEESLSVKGSNKRVNYDAHAKISIVSPESMNFRRSRSGRLLLPPLEFWRNQMPVYDADHSLTEIQEGASFVSPCRGSGTQSRKKAKEVVG